MPHLLKYLLIPFIVFLSTGTAQGEDCELVYGIYNDYKPYEWLENGTAYGINIDLLKALASEAQCGYTIINKPWAEMLDMLADGSLTILSASLTQSRMEHFIQIPPDFVQYRYLVGRKGSAFVHDMSLLSDKTILVLDRSVAHESLLKEYSGTINTYGSERLALMALQAGFGDYALVDDTSGMGNEDLMGNLRITSPPMFPTLYGFMLKKDNPLYGRLYIAAEKLKSRGEYYSIINRGKDYRHNYLLKWGIAVCGVLSLLLFLIFLWNKSLQLKVRQRTKGLNEAIGRHLETEKALLLQTGEHEKLLNLLQAILESIPELVYIVDKKANILWHNRVDRGEFNINLIVTELLDMAPSLKSEEFSAQDEDDRLWKVLALDFPYRGQPGILLFATDITENIRLRDELFMTSRYSALGEMASLVAHEINNPLGCIMHNFDFLRQILPANLDSDLHADVQDSVHSTLKSLGKIKIIIDELRGYTMRQTKEYENVRLRECVESAVSITSFLINKSTGNFKLTLEADWTVNGNYGQIEQMIINILQNACYALTEKTQSITCTLDSTETHATLCIADQGVGMDEIVKKNACKPYFSTRKENGGTGLGLSLTSRLIKEHGGFLEIASEPGEGSRVTLFFPK